MDSSEYDNKLKRAQQNLQSFEQSCHSAGKSINDLSKENVEYVRSMGKMETASRSLRGKINEMTQAYTELSAQYKHLTDAEKQSPFGQAMSKSLDELRGRIQTSRKELDDINGSLKTTSSESTSTSGVLDQLAGKFGLSGSAATKLGAALGVATAACKVAKDAFMANESTVDEWGRTVDSAKSLYNGFLVALNTGDIGGFLSRIDQIVAAARDAYNAMDRLNTMARIQATQISAQQTENDRLRAMLQYGRYIAPNDGRAPTPGMKDGQILTPAQMKTLEKQLQNGTQKVVGLIGNEVKQTNQAVEAVSKRWAAELGMSANEFKAGTSSMAEFDRRLAGYDLYKKFEAQHTTKTQVETGYLGGGKRTKWVRDNARNPYEQYRGWGVFRVDGDRYNELVQLMQQRDQRAATAYSMMGQVYRTMNRAEGVTVRGIMGRGGGVTGRGSGRVGRTTTSQTPPPAAAGSIDAQTQKVQALQKAWRAAADDDSRAKIKTQIEEAQAELDKMEGKVKAQAPEGSMKALQEELSKLQQEQQLVTTSDEWEKYNQRIQAVQQSMKELRGEVDKIDYSKLTGNNMTAWMSAQQSSLNSAEIGSEEYKAISANIIDAKTLSNVLSTALENDITISPDTIKELWSKIIGGEDIPDTVWKELEQTINTAIEDRLDIGAIKIKVDTGDVVQTAKQTGDAWKGAAMAVQSVGSAISQLEDPSLKIAGIVGQAIANIALGFAQATAASSKYGIFGWLAAVAGGIGTMMSTISAIKSATAGYSEGGEIRGNTYSGDQIMANGGTIGLNAGEIVLNKAQQGALASMLDGNNNMSNRKLQAVVTGEQIRFVLNNNAKRRGKSESVII